jgi:hypothetical protein
VGVEGERVCVCLRATECRKFCRPKARNVFEKGRKKECVLKGQRKECVWKGTQEEMCSLSDAGGNVQRNGGKSVRKYMSAGVDRKVDTGGAAHLSEVTALPLSASHSLVMPLEV